jgi:hypothetical protein
MSNYLLKGLEELRGRRQGKTPGEILKSIPDETLQDIYLEVMNEINDSYISGTIKFVEENHPDLDREIDEVDRKINKIWRACNEGMASIEDFNAALDLYKSLYLEGISLYGRKTEDETGGKKFN